mmetsp:Transcript_60729/g.130452  ORF Transcript_60729/g.130452 Transcript_60729/m.130452 type:complete len:264 (-) Transcript_60729:99-890(-)
MGLARSSSVSVSRCAGVGVRSMRQCAGVGVRWMGSVLSSTSVRVRGVGTRLMRRRTQGIVSGAPLSLWGPTAPFAAHSAALLRFAARLSLKTAGASSVSDSPSASVCNRCTPWLSLSNMLANSCIVGPTPCEAAHTPAAIRVLVPQLGERDGMLEPATEEPQVVLPPAPSSLTSLWWMRVPLSPHSWSRSESEPVEHSSPRPASTEPIRRRNGGKRAGAPLWRGSRPSSAVRPRIRPRSAGRHKLWGEALPTAWYASHSHGHR